MVSYTCISIYLLSFVTEYNVHSTVLSDVVYCKVTIENNVTV